MIEPPLAPSWSQAELIPTTPSLPVLKEPISLYLVVFAWNPFVRACTHVQSKEHASFTVRL